MSRQPDPFRMHDPHRRRGKNVETSLLERYRPLILGLHGNGLTYDQIVESFANNEDARKADFQPTRAQIKKWVPEWIKSPTCNSHVSKTSAASPVGNAIASPHAVGTYRNSSPRGEMDTPSDPNIDPGPSPRNDVGSHKTGASVSFMLPPIFQQLTSHTTLPVETDKADFDFPVHAAPEALSKRANGSGLEKLDKILCRDNQESKFMRDRAQDCFMTGVQYEAPWSSTVDPPLMRAPSRASSMSLDQKSFWETHDRTKEPLRKTNASSVILAMSTLSMSTGRRSNSGGTYSIGSEKGARIASATPSSMFFDSGDSMFHKDATLVFQNQDVRVPLRQVLGFSEIAAEFVKRRSSGLLECRNFATEHPEIFYEDPGIFYQAAGLALQEDKKTLARHCFDCFNFIRAYHNLAARAFGNFMLDLIAAEADGGELTEHQSKINATFLESGQEGLKQLKKDVHVHHNWSLKRDVPSTSLQELPAPVCYDEFAKRWSTTPTPATMEIGVDHCASPATPRVLSESSASSY